MPHYILKIKDRFIEWSTVVDAPVSYGMTREDMREHLLAETDGSRASEIMVDERLDRADAKGSSDLMGMTAEEVVAGNRAGPDESELTFDEIYEAYVKPERLKVGHAMMGESWDLFIHSLEKFCEVLQGVVGGKVEIVCTPGSDSDLSGSRISRTEWNIALAIYHKRVKIAARAVEVAQHEAETLAHAMRLGDEMMSQEWDCAAFFNQLMEELNPLVMRLRERAIQAANEAYVFADGAGSQKYMDEGARLIDEVSSAQEFPMKED